MPKSVILVPNEDNNLYKTEEETEIMMLTVSLMEYFSACAEATTTNFYQYRITLFTILKL